MPDLSSPDSFPAGLMTFPRLFIRITAGRGGKLCEVLQLVRTMTYILSLMI